MIRHLLEKEGNRGRVNKKEKQESQFQVWTRFPLSFWICPECPSVFSVEATLVK